MYTLTTLELGQFGEQVAVEYLLHHNYTLVGRNIRTHCGEIDIIVNDENALVAVEVKTRRTQQYGLPCEAVNIGKQRHIRQSMLLYMAMHNMMNRKVRFDVVEVYVVADTVRHLRHLKGCF